MSELSADEIVEALRQLGESWRGEHDQDDDVTLMVLKAKPHSHEDASSGHDTLHRDSC